MTTKPQLGKLLIALRDGYPNLFTESPDQWAARVSAFHNKIKRFDWGVVKEACDRAHDKYPDRFPTAGQLKGLCIAVDEEQRREHREREEEIARQRDDADTAARVSEERRTVIPDSRSDQERWAAKGKSPFHRLARRWKSESKNGDFDPNRPSPQGVGRRRMAELMQVIEENTQTEFSRISGSRKHAREPGDDDHRDDPFLQPPGDDCPV